MKPTFKFTAAILVLALSFGTQAQEGQAPPPTEVDKLGEHVYRVFLGAYNSLVVIGTDEVLITDPGLPFRPPMLMEEIAKITDKPVTKVVLSHEHYDHVAGAQAFPDAEIICHETCQETFDLDILGLRADVDTTFDKFMSIDMGTTVVEIHHWVPADGDGASAVYLPNEQVVFTADLYERKSLSPGSINQDKNYLGTRVMLNNIAEWDIKYAVNAHASSMDPQDLYEGQQYHNDLYDAVTAEIFKIMESEGMLAAFNAGGALKNTLKLPKYQDWANYEEALPVHIERLHLAIFHGG